LKDRIRSIFEESIRTKQDFLVANTVPLAETISTLVSVLESGKKIVLFGNGGSAADAQHIAAEFVNRYIIERQPLPAIALTTDSSVLTSIANDFGYEQIFAKQIEALGESGDAALGISTSGTSPNVLKGLETAQRIGMICIGLGGPAESPMKRYCQHYLYVGERATARIQEVHELVGHTIVEIVDEIMFGSEKRL
jgi:D-sedoheptulose 7-phosphate isomerase